MACAGIYKRLSRAFCTEPKLLHVCKYSLSTTTPRRVRSLRKAPPREHLSASARPSNADQRANKENSDSSGDVFVDGEVKHKKTLRMTLERMGLSKDADPSQAVTLSARIRKRLQAKKKKYERRTEGEEEEEQDSSAKRKARNLRHQTKDLNRLDSGVVVKILTDRIIYDKGDIVALDKPYGLPVHGGPGMRHSIDGLLPQVARRLDKAGSKGTPELHLIHRLDKETTGVMLLARTEMTARILHELFRKREIIKRYLVVTVGIPSPKEGILDMPMIEKEVAGKHRMVVKPDIGDVYPDSWGVRTSRSNRDAHTAVTKYKVLSHYNNCAVVQLEPSTGVKHQIRVHLAQGLGCPILGDHKYSHHDRLAPQKLTDSILGGLGITQPKARTVPMHLHAQQLTIPETFDGRNIFISTRVPAHFSHNMKRLGLKFET